MLTLVMSWLAYEFTDSAFLTATFAAARMCPQLLGPLSGTIADRVNRRKLVAVMLLLQIAFAGTGAILLSANILNFGLLCVIGFSGGVIRSLTFTTVYALTSDIVGKDDTTNAIALNGIAMHVTRIVGPAVGGILISFFGPANCFWIAATWGGLALITLFMMQMPARKMAASQESVLRNIVEGFKYVIHSRDILSVLAVSFTANLFVWPAYQSFMPIFAKDNLGLGPDGLGFLFTASGVGALIGAIILASMGNFRRKGLVFLCGTSLHALFFGIFALMRSVPPALVLLGLCGLSSSAFGTLQASLTLILAPEDMRARCVGFLAMAIGVLPFGCLLLGAIANTIGASLTTGISCAIMFVALIAIAVILPNLRRLG